MKYVLLLVVAIVLIRIDIVFNLVEKGIMMMKSEETTKTDDLGRPAVIVRSDRNVNLTPREKYLGIMANFRVNPILAFREQAMLIFRKHPQMFTERLDKDLEAQIYSWRDLVVQNEAEVPLYLLDLNSILKGENLDIIRRFFSVILDLNVDMFMNSYVRTKDGACVVVTLVESAVPAEERIPELYERQGILEDYIARENLPADKKLFATTCLTALKLFLEKEAPPVQPVEPPAEDQPATPPEAGTTP